MFKFLKGLFWVLVFGGAAALVLKVVIVASAAFIQFQFFYGS